MVNEDILDRPVQILRKTMFLPPAQSPDELIQLAASIKG